MNWCSSAFILEECFWIHASSASKSVTNWKALAQLLTFGYGFYAVIYLSVEGQAPAAPQGEENQKVRVLSFGTDSDVSSTHPDFGGP